MNTSPRTTGSNPPDDGGISTMSAPSGAGFTTFDVTLGGCLDSPNGINCNHYTAKDRVYMNGGPSAGGIGDGTYYFSVLVPGYQNGGFIDGANGNLSDTTIGDTADDNGSGDLIGSRTFTVLNHQIISYSGTHALGTSPNGEHIIGLAPFDDTSNLGGVYIMAICTLGATNPSQCKYDAFKVEKAPRPPVEGVLTGLKYYDANANGQFDLGEEGIPGWLISFHDGVSRQVYTDAIGAFSLSLPQDLYIAREALGGGTWMQTGNLVDQSSVSGGSSVTLNADKTYWISVVDDSLSQGLYFGNLCIGPAPNLGGKTLGFWSNKNGQALMKSTDNYVSALAFLTSLNLRKANGSNFDPISYSGFRTWILGATATNMAYMLSAQLATMELNVRYGFVSSTLLIYAPGTASANANGFASVGAVMDEANNALGIDGLTLDGDPNRPLQEALKTALDKGNNNLNFVQPGPNACPVPLNSL